MLATQLLLIACLVLNIASGVWFLVESVRYRHELQRLMREIENYQKKSGEIEIIFSELRGLEEKVVLQ